MPLQEEADPVLLGFAEQVKLLNVGAQAVVDRAVQEGQRMVLEGVHLVPGFIPSCADARALILPLVVAVRDEGLHRGHFVVRERETDGRRPVERYLENFGNIRKIQDFILERSQSEGTLVIENHDIDEAVGLAVDALYELIEEKQEGDEGRGA
jgi:2-phosphoglycerate kinase